MTTKQIWQSIQAKVGVTTDGIPGPLTAKAVAEALALDTSYEDEHVVKASSFADPADIAAFRKCKATGASDQQCFKVGDNGIGFTGLDCTNELIPYCALPVEDWKERWGTAKNAAGRTLKVTWNGQTESAVLGDTMPHKINIHNGCGIDFAPGLQKRFNLTPPFIIANVRWKWA